MSEKPSDLGLHRTGRTAETDAMSARPEATATSREVSHTERRGNTHPSEQGSARQHTNRTVMDSVRSCMNTSRAHTALAALSAQKNALESRLAIVESALQAESKTSLIKKGRGGSNNQRPKKT